MFKLGGIMKKDLYKLTNPQQSIWFTEQFFEGSTINNICGTTIINENVDFEILKKAINTFLKDNDTFRFHIILDKDGLPYQYVTPFSEIDFRINFIKDKRNLIKLENKVVSTVFNIFDNDLFNIQIFKFNNGKGGFITCCHHLIADAWTAGIVASRITSIYSDLLNNKEAQHLQTSYINYINEEKEYMNSDKFNADKDYWQNTFNTIPEVGTIPYSFTSTVASCTAERDSFVLNKSLVLKIDNYCRKNKISTFNFFMAVFAVYIGRVSNLSNFTLGTPILNRSNFIEKNTPGMFISTVPLVFSIRENSTFLSFAKEVSINSMGLLRHQKYPYQKILEHIRKSNPSQPNLYDILISYQNSRTNRASSNINYDVRWTFNKTTADSLDISIHDMNDDGMLNISYDYQLSKYTKREIDLLNKRIEYIVSQVLDNPNINISNINILTEDESLVIKKFNSTKHTLNSNLTIIDLFEKAVKKFPNNTAIIYNNQPISYIDLNNLVNAIALIINERNFSNKRIAVIANKSLKIVATFLAIMKTGNSYIPIDPTYPKERIEYILKNSCCDLVVCDSNFPVDYVDTFLLKEIDLSKKYEFASVCSPDELAYMIYTSGSTGNPKGVPIKQKNIVNTLIWRKNYYNFDSSITVLQIPSFSFDSSVEDIFTPLISGSILVIPGYNKIDINKACEYIEKYNINHFLVVPSLYKIFLAEKSKYLKNFKFVTIAGESFNQNLVKEHFRRLPHVRLVNEYGPTENSVCSTSYEFSKENSSVYIGSPIYNCKCFVLDKTLNFLPPEIPGELYLSGKGLSEGYFNNPVLTSERFITTKKFNYPLYKTGDIVSFDAKRGLVFVGRNDSQIKMHGFRIELQEISNLILKNKDVKECISIYKKFDNSKSAIFSYVLTKSNNFSLENLYSFIKANLPYYMIPEIIVLDKFPTTPNGKIDTRALPAKLITLEKKHSQPTNRIEEEMLKICKEVLNTKDLFVDDNLFDVGMADSLNILTITSKLFAKGFSVPAQMFYKYSTIEKIVESLKVEQEKEEIEFEKVKPLHITNFNNFNYDNLSFNYSNILLTGATGFLGIHILYDLLTKTNARINCIVRKKENFSSYDRLKDLFLLYFTDKKIELFEKRVKVYEGDLSAKYFGLTSLEFSEISHCDNVIHAAAITKHYGDFKIFYNSNVIATKNIVDFCTKFNIVLNYMSTLSIGENSIPNSNIISLFTENDFYIGQKYKGNVYISSKFKAESLVLDAQKIGLNANIYRLGNLMGRYYDGKFQVNKYDNAFYMKLLVLSKLAQFPNSLNDKILDFSPIDNVSSAIIKLMCIPNLKNCIFHLANLNSISVSQLASIFNNLGVKLNCVTDIVFTKSLEQNPNLMRYFIAELSNDFSINSNIIVKNDITNEFLDMVGFNWPSINETYISKFLNNTNFYNDLKNPIN